MGSLKKEEGRGKVVNFNLLMRKKQTDNNKASSPAAGRSCRSQRSRRSPGYQRDAQPRSETKSWKELSWIVPLFPLEILLMQEKKSKTHMKKNVSKKKKQTKTTTKTVGKTLLRQTIFGLKFTFQKNEKEEKQFSV